jgi:O-glycosyl hydrolase
MSDDGANVAWTATNTLHDLAMERNSDIKILLSSWGPPKSLKSNALLQQGTLKKDDSGHFMYDDFAQYWSDVLDNVPFNPDYISIQNEPTFVTSGWTTCQWAAAETTSLPDYTIAFDKVYDKIKTRTTVPIMVGPESQDIPTFAAFGNILKDKASCGAYSYHPYNINSGTSASQVTSSLQSIGNFSTKPSIMTEFSDNLDWYNTALFINKSLVYANSSGYIYWKLAWATPTSGTDAGMISINSSGQYSVTPFYYLIKHFSKNIDAGYHRIEATSSSTSLNVSAFVSADNKKITLVIINDGTVAIDTDFTATGKTISAVSASQSKVGAYYKSVDTVLGKPISLPAKSITTLVLDI